MTEVSWSRCDGEACVRLAGVAPGADVQVRPGTAGFGVELPPMGGRLVRHAGDLCFLPRFPFLAGTSYTVAIEGRAVAILVRPRPERLATTEVLDIWPTATEVPRNLLRLYVWFSAPMSEGYAAGHVRLADEAGDVMVGGLLPTEHELWDGGRRRLTVLLDPARIKRGLVAHESIGYPLRPGGSFRLVVDEGFRDATGLPLRAPAERRYHIAGEERRHVEPGSWTLAIPPSHTREPLGVAFSRPLDRALLARCLHVVGPDGQRVEGMPQIGPEERSWQLSPRERWVPGPHHLVVDAVLEDVAGNSVSRVFDRDLTRPEDRSRAARRVTVAFRPLLPS